MSHADLLRLVHPLKGNQRGTIPDLLRCHLMSQPPNRIKIEMVDRHLQNFESKVGLIRPLPQACSQMPPQNSGQISKHDNPSANAPLKILGAGTGPSNPPPRTGGALPKPSKTPCWNQLE